MAEPVPGLQDGTTKAVFLNVHVKRIEQNLAIGASDPFSKGDTFGGGVHDELFEAIDDFNAENDVVILGRFNRFAHTLDGAVGKNLFVFVG